MALGQTGKTTIYNATQKTKDRATRTTLKTGGATRTPLKTGGATRTTLKTVAI
jgi:hypothetical protein